MAFYVDVLGFPLDHRSGAYAQFATGATRLALYERAAMASILGAELKDLDVWPTPEERPDFYVDYGETGPYVAEVGAGECAGT